MGTEPNPLGLVCVGEGGQSCEEGYHSAQDCPPKSLRLLVPNARALVYLGAEQVCPSERLPPVHLYEL